MSIPKQSALFPSLGVALGVLIAFACGIVHFATLDSYTRTMAKAPVEARVVRIDRGEIIYETHEPDNRPGKTKDGWSGPYRLKETPAAAAQTLKPGDAIKVHNGVSDVLLDGTPPPGPFALAGVAFGLLVVFGSIAGFVVSNGALKRAARDPETLLEFLARRSTLLGMAAGVAFIAISALLGALAFFLPASEGAGGRIFIGALGAVGVLAGLLTFVGALRKRSGTHPLLRLLREESHRVVRVYGETVRVNGIASTYGITFCLDDRSQERLHLGSIRPETVLPLIKERLQNAKFGYDPGAA